MAALTKEDLVEAIKTVFLDPTVVGPETHERHHRQYEEDLIEREQNKSDRRRIRNTIIGGIGLSFASGIGLLLWYGVHYILSHIPDA